MADLGAETPGMVLDGVSVTPVVTPVPNSTDKLVLYTPNPSLSPSSNHIAGLVYAGTTNYWIFSVAKSRIARDRAEGTGLCFLRMLRVKIDVCWQTLSQYG